MRFTRRVVTTPDHLAHVAAVLSTRNAFAFDIEAAGAHRGVPARCNVTWLSIATGGGNAWTIPMGHPIGDTVVGERIVPTPDKNGKMINRRHPVWEQPPAQLDRRQVFDTLAPIFMSDRIKVAHSMPTDAVAVSQHLPGGQIPPPPYFDTIVAGWLLNENVQKGLKPTVKRLYGHAYDTEDVGKCVEKHPFSKVTTYSYLDSHYTWLLYRRYRRMIAERDLTGVMDLEMGVLEQLLPAFKAGTMLDADALSKLKVELTDETARRLAACHTVAGREFNVASTQQKQRLLFAPKSEGGRGLKVLQLTDTGQPSTSAEALEPHRGDAVVDALLDYAETSKLLSTYVDGYLGDPEKDREPIVFDDQVPGRLTVHTNLCQYGTVTGRFSSFQPNLQNIPRPDTVWGKPIRSLFVAPPVHKLVVADYGQVELVILAHYLGEGALYEGILRGIDPHTATAATVFGVTPLQVTKAQRQCAKGLNFAVVYGAGPGKVAQMAGITVAEAKKFMRKHEQLFPEIYRFKKRVIAEARRRKPPHVRTLLGRYRRVPELCAREDGIRKKAERQIFNSLIQGSGADLMKLAITRLPDALPAGARMALTIHDELVCVAPEEIAEQCAKGLEQAMVGPGIADLLKVPLTTDVKIVDCWAEAK
ncbi:DNA polymerase [Actinomadura atramentaria]|uniref:DNA polymerase n=1 Tax=Actinomadura atramentaria TaxID=1990 RepID=UPI00039D55D9|nr:DNA polymerase [Actinomadura atramentaria]